MDARKYDSRKEFHEYLIKTLGLTAIEADPSILCWDNTQMQDYLNARPALKSCSSNDPTEHISQVLNGLPKFTHLTTISRIDELKRYVDAHGLDVRLTDFPTKLRFAKVVRALLKWKVGENPTLLDLQTCGLPCSGVSFDVSRHLDDVIEDMGVAVKNWIRQKLYDSTNTPPMSTLEYLNKLSIFHIKGRHVMVHTGVGEPYVDPVGYLHVMSKDGKVDKKEIKQIVKQTFK
jgi:hypothetical protein